MEPTRIPSRIDDPMYFLFVPIDEFAPFVLGIFVGIMTDQLMFCMLLGFAAMKGYARFRDSRPDGFLWHLLYWWGFVPSRNRSMPNPMIRRFLP